MSIVPSKQMMQAVKFVVGLFPAKFRKNMRSHLWLFNLYSKSLQNSGLFYGFPSPEKLQKLYVNTIKRQSIDIERKIDQCPRIQDVNCLVISSGEVDVDIRTIDTLVSSGLFRKIFFMSIEKSAFEQVRDVCPEHSIVELAVWQRQDLNYPLMVIYGGDFLHSKAIEVFLLDLDFTKEFVLYSDTDHIDSKGQRHSAEFYPDWNPDFQLATGYVNTGVVINGEILLKQFIQFIYNYELAPVVALWLANLYLSNSKVAIQHIPFSLIHRSVNENFYWQESLTKFNHKNFNQEQSNLKSVAKIKWDTTSNPLVSLIIPTKNAKELVTNCIESIISKTSYENYEILLIDNNSDDADALAYFEHLEQNEAKVRVLKYSFDFNYSAINNFAVEHANGSVVGLVNNDIEVITSDWLDFMVGHVLREDIGCVGAKLLYPDNRIQHAGVVMGYGGGAGHAHKYFPRYHPGYLNRLIASQNFSAVTAACLLVKKSDYVAVNGLNETDLTIAFNDVDFCLRILSLGRRNLYCAEAELYHHESISRGLDDTAQKRARFESELVYLQDTWKAYIEHDPAYNPNLTLKRENFSLKE